MLNLVWRKIPQHRKVSRQFRGGNVVPYGLVQKAIETIYVSGPWKDCFSIYQTNESLNDLRILFRTFHSEGPTIRKSHLGGIRSRSRHKIMLVSRSKKTRREDREWLTLNHRDYYVCDKSCWNLPPRASVDIWFETEPRARVDHLSYKWRYNVYD